MHPCRPRNFRDTALRVCVLARDRAGHGLENLVQDHGLRPRKVGTIPMEVGDDETNDLLVSDVIRTNELQV